MNKGFKDWKVLLGFAVAALFLFLAFRKVDFAAMWLALKQAKYWYLAPALAIIFFAHWLRALRWRYLLAPIGEVGTGTLYSALLIGYMANTFLPAHLGEFIRAYIIGKKRPIRSSAVFATIVIERIIDVFSLLIIMALTIVVFPFPQWVRTSGYLSFGAIVVLFILLVLMKKYREQSSRLLKIVLKPLPDKIGHRLSELFHSFLDGVTGLKNWRHYLIVGSLSILIWFCYGVIFNFGFFAFNFNNIYDLPWMTSLVLLVITTIAVVVPSSPGYVGTYHYLCQVSLGFFGVPKSEALTYAFVVHGVNFFPILIVGFVLVSWMGMNLKSIQKEAKNQADVIEEDLAHDS